MTFYFTNFNITKYELNEKTYDLTNITLRYKFKETVKNFNFAFYNYTIPEGIELENLSELYYDDPRYTWLIILSNNIIDPHFDYPLNYDNFRNYIISKYGSLQYAETNIHHFERNSIYKNQTDKLINLYPPIIIDKKVYENTLYPDGTKKYPELPVLYDKEKNYVTILDHEIRLNDMKKNIKLLDKRYLSKIENLTKKIFN